MPGTIVLGYDASPGAEHALEAALELALQFGDSLVIAYGTEPPGGPSEESSEHRHVLERQGEQLTGRAVARARDAGVEARVALVSQRAAPALASLGNDYDARMIVVGTYGESPIRGAILGSTPHKLLHLAERPVLVVPGS
jgi:nucleotide-binding universal stress UspA family protein